MGKVIKLNEDLIGELDKLKGLRSYSETIEDLLRNKERVDIIRRIDLLESNLKGVKSPSTPTQLFTPASKINLDGYTNLIDVLKKMNKYVERERLPPLVEKLKALPKDHWKEDGKILYMDNYYQADVRAVIESFV